MALEERGRLQGSADTLQPVKVTVLELQKKKNEKPKMSALQEAYIKTAAWSRQESHPSQHHFHDTMFAWRDARGVPQLLCTQHPPTDLSTGRGVPCFLGSTYPFGLYSIL